MVQQRLPIALQDRLPSPLEIGQERLTNGPALDDGIAIGIPVAQLAD